MSTNAETRLSAAFKANDIGEKARPLVPTLTKMLVDERDPVFFLTKDIDILSMVITDIVPVRPEDIQRLLTEITDEDEQKRIYAAIALKSAPRIRGYRADFTDILQAYATAAKDKSPYVRAWTAHAFADMVSALAGDPGATNMVPSFLHMLTDTRPALRREAVRALGKIEHADHSVVACIGARLTDTEPDVRAVAYESVEEWAERSPQSVLPYLPALTQALHNAEWRWNRIAAANALGNMRRYAAPAIPSLVKVMHDKDSYVRCRATDALGKICARCRGHSGFTDYPRSAGTNTPRRIEPPDHIDLALKAIVDALDDKENNQAGEALARMGRFAESALSELTKRGMYEQADSIYNDLPVGDDIDTIIKNTAHLNKYVRRNAIIDLGRMQTTNASAIVDLVDGLKDPESAVNYAAAKAIESIGKPCLDKLSSAIQEPHDPEVLKRMLAAMAELGPIARGASPVAIQLLSTNQPGSVIRAACNVIESAQAQTLEAIDPLILLLDHPDRAVQGAAAGALTQYGRHARRAMPKLTKLLLEDINEADSSVVGCMAAIGIDRDLAKQVAQVNLDTGSYAAHDLLDLLLPYPDEALKFLKNNDRLAITIMSRYSTGIFGRIVRLKGRKYRHLKEYLLEHPDIPPQVLAYSRDERYLPRIQAMIKEADPHRRSLLEACARALGATPDRIVHISKGNPGDFKPDSAWPNVDKDRMTSYGGHGDGSTPIIITGRLTTESGKSPKNPKFYRTNDAWLMGEKIKDDATPENISKDGRFVYFGSVFAAYTDGRAKEPGPYQTGSAHILIEADECEPLLVQFYDEMPELEITLSAQRRAEDD